MSKFTEKVKSIFRGPRVVKKEEAIEIDDWVNEGGTPHPDGPPRVVNDKDKPGH